MRVELIAIALFFLTPALSLGAEVVHVPGPISAKAFFALSGQGDTEATEKKTYMGQGADGARVVIERAMVLTGTMGSRFAIGKASSPEAPWVKLVKGGFRLQTGSTASVIELGETRVTASGAELAIAEVEGKWLVNVLEVSSSGNVSVGRDVSRPVSGDPAFDELEGQPDAPATPHPIDMPTVVRISEGEAVRLSLDGSLENVEKHELHYLNAVSVRLSERPRLPLLQPVDVEDLHVLSSQKADSESMLTEIELDQIEIEAGCVEICVD